MMNSHAKIWEETVLLPTYETGAPEKNPLFLENRVYQGSSGVVYPKPVVERIADHPSDKAWQAVFLENAYLKIMILPQLGGRIQMAYDKTRQRHFIYYNEVIKPALVGLTGPWISGGIEFNWPQHHRPSTFEPLEYLLEAHSDGSKTVWCSEIDRMHRTKGMAGFTLYPDKAYLEIKVKLFNRTPLPQTFLWWANPALHVNDYYQSVFPPDVHAVFDHGKRDVSAFPIARGTYYKVDYSAGVDISRYKNIPVPTSYMAVNSRYDFVGGYEHDSKGGILHVANRHLSPGKKQWTWGNGDFGYAWDRNLTDRNGPYVELMCGVYTDNQPDFSWLYPYEEKAFTQYFMPYHELGMVKNATKDAFLNLELSDGIAAIKVLSTAHYPGAAVTLYYQGEILFQEKRDLSPEAHAECSCPVPPAAALHALYLEVKEAGGRVLADWQPEAPGAKPLPEAAKAAKLPPEVGAVEALYLHGLHLEQYRHATYRPEAYYLEGLRREPGSVCCNKAMGLLCLRKGDYEPAAAYFQTAVATLTQRNPNPNDGEPYFYLGQALEGLGKDDEAYAAYYKSVWNAYCMDTGYFHLARIAAKRKNWTEALDLVNRALDRNQNHHKARTLKTYLGIKLGGANHLNAFMAESLERDPFNIGVLFLDYSRTEDPGEREGKLQTIQARTIGNIHTYIEYALDLAAFGAYAEAMELLEVGIARQKGPVYPMAWYFLAAFKTRSGEAAEAFWNQAAQACPDFCFPNKVEELSVLQLAIERNPGDAKAPYYLGNYRYANRQYAEARAAWERSIALDAHFPTPHRNLALAYFNKFNDAQRAVDALERAFALDPTDARVFMELDQLHKKINTPPEERLRRLERHLDLVAQRDDLYVERAALLNLTGACQQALDLLTRRLFHPWEGGEGKVTGQYTLALTELAKASLRQGNPEESIRLLRQSLVYPPNLGEGKLSGAQENDTYYWLGVAYRQAGQAAEASQCLEKAASGNLEPAIPWFYNDQQPDKIFYKGLALLQLGKTQAAAAVFDNLTAFADAHLEDTVRMDYFAVSYPEIQVWDMDFQQKNRVHCYYIRGLGRLGKGATQPAEADFNQVLALENHHAGAWINLHMAQAT